MWTVICVVCIPLIEVVKLITIQVIMGSIIYIQYIGSSGKRLHNSSFHDDQSPLALIRGRSKVKVPPEYHQPLIICSLVI